MIALHKTASPSDRRHHIVFGAVEKINNQNLCKVNRALNHYLMLCLFTLSHGISDKRIHFKCNKCLFNIDVNDHL